MSVLRLFKNESGKEGWMIFDAMLSSKKEGFCGCMIFL
jgi:hypothetical protein